MFGNRELKTTVQETNRSLVDALVRVGDVTEIAL